MAKRALLIGINKYQIAGADLRGCVNDVNDLSAALIEFCGFKKGDITVLIDDKATKKAMQAGIKALVRDSKKGDVALMHYSGHGSNVPDDNGDEADGRDEILCPNNLDWNDPFRDDWLRTTFDGIRAGVSFTVIMDCCHSGTNTRALLPPDAPIDRAVPAESMGPERGRIETESAEEGHERTPPLRAQRAQDEGHRQRGAARGAHHGVPRHPDISRRVHQRPVQRRADLCAWSNRSAPARAVSHIRSCTIGRPPCSRRRSSIRCRSSKAGRPDSTSRSFQHRGTDRSGSRRSYHYRFLV